MTRVLHLTRDFPPHHTGGISTAVHGMVHASRRAGIDVAVASFDGWRPRAAARASVPAPPPTVEDGVPVARLTSPAHLPAVAELARTHSPDIVHVHHAMLWDAALELRARTAVTIHVLQAEQNRLRGLAGPTLSSTAQTRAIVEADVVMAPSRAVATAVGPRARIVGLGFDDCEPMRRAASRPSARDGGAVLYAGRFADINGTAELFAALPDILAQAPTARAVVAGGLPENPRADAKWRARWRQSTPAAIAARVDLVGWLAPSALAAHYATAAAVVVPSWFETFGLTALEAMAWGAPLACSAGELVQHGRTGLRFAARDVRALTTAVLALRTDRSQACALGRAAGEHARRRYTWDSVIPQLIAAYAAT